MENTLTGLRGFRVKDEIEWKSQWKVNGNLGGVGIFSGLFNIPSGSSIDNRHSLNPNPRHSRIGMKRRYGS